MFKFKFKLSRIHSPPTQAYLMCTSPGPHSLLAGWSLLRMKLQWFTPEHLQHDNHSVSVDDSDRNSHSVSALALSVTSRPACLAVTWFDGWDEVGQGTAAPGGRQAEGNSSTPNEWISAGCSPVCGPLTQRTN